MSKLREAAQNVCDAWQRGDATQAAVDDLREALAAPEPTQEPVAWMRVTGAIRLPVLVKPKQEDGWAIIPLYARPAPPQTPMTEEQIKLEVGASPEYWATSKLFILAIARAIEAFPGIK